MSMIGFAAPMRKIELNSVKRCFAFWKVIDEICCIDSELHDMLMRSDGLRVLSRLLVGCMMSLLILQYSCRQLHVEIGQQGSNGSRMTKVSVANHEQRFDRFAAESVPWLFVVETNRIGNVDLSLILFGSGGTENDGGRTPPVVTASKSCWGCWCSTSKAF